MGFVTAKCPNCGADIELSEDREFGFCTYCGTKVVQDKIVVEHRGKVSISGIANENAILDRAFLFIEDEKYDEANIYLEKALDINPRCSKAYLGKLLCDYRVSSVNQLKQSALPITGNEYYRKAVRFASASELSELDQIKAQIEDNIKQVSTKLKNTVDAVDKQLSDAKTFLQSQKKQYVLNQTKRVTLFIVSIVVVIAILFFAIGALALSDESSGSTFFLILSLVFVVIEVIIILKRRKLKKLNIAYDNTKASLYSLQNQLENAQQEYEIWIERNHKTY